MPYSTTEEETFDAALNYLVELRAVGALSYLHEEAVTALAGCLTGPMLRVTAGRREREFWIFDTEYLTWRQL